MTVSAEDKRAAKANVAIYARYLKLSRTGASLSACCPFHKDHRPSLTIWRGFWKCWAGCGGGDTIDFLCRLQGLSFTEAVAVLAGRGSEPSPRAAREAWRLPSGSSCPSDDRLSPPASTLSLVNELWAGADDPRLAEFYLASRGIRLRPKPLPAALRGHKAVWCSESGFARPCVLAAIQSGPDGVLTAVQRIWCDRSYIADTPKGCRATDLRTPKKTLGSCFDGAVRLFELGVTLGLTEGVEDALACYQMFRVPVWATVGAARMASVRIPPSVEELLIFADRDDAGRRAALKTEAAHPDKHVVITYPDPPYKDWCEQLAGAP